jgi:hypothetical protein
LCPLAIRKKRIDKEYNQQPYPKAKLYVAHYSMPGNIQRVAMPDQIQMRNSEKKKHNYNPIDSHLLA